MNVACPWVLMNSNKAEPLEVKK